MRQIAPGVIEYGNPSTPSNVPQVVTMRQAQLALNAAGKLSQVESTIAGLSDPLKTRAQIEWRAASVVRRDGPLLLQLQPLLGWSDADIDALFIQAVAIP